jgi:hypothetical protein
MTAGAFFHQRLDSISKITRDKWGDRTSFILYQSVPCRFTEDDTKIREVTVEDERIDALAYIGKKYTVAVDYVVTFESQDYIVTKIAKARDLFGNVHHQKLLLKSR